MEQHEGGRAHHRHLEQARDQVLELLSRQAVEAALVNRSVQPEQDVVSQLLVRQQRAALEQRLAHLHPADIAFVLENLPPESRDQAWALVRPERRGAVLLESAEALREALIGDAPAEELATLMQPLGSDAIAELVGGLEEPAQRAVLARLDSLHQSQVRSLLSFPAGSVGAAMELAVVCVAEDATLAAVQEQLRRRREPLPPHTNQLFVVDRGNRPRGLLPLSGIVVGQPQTRVADAMSTTAPIFFYTDDPLDDAVAAFEKYDLVAAPVVNLHEQIVGRLTVDAIVDELNERARREALRQVGLSGADEDWYAPPLEAARRRWPWLAINLCTAFAASRVIGAFEPMIAKLVALAALLPIVASVGGNAGNQSVALVLQALSQRQSASLLRHFLLREIRIALVNGALWGAVLGTATLAIYRDFALSCVIALALLLNLTVGATVGVLAPALLHRAGRDPAMGASIILTAATDSLGFLIFLGLAALLLLH